MTSKYSGGIRVADKEALIPRKNPISRGLDGYIIPTHSIENIDYFNYY
ncbi:hypothetical protein J2Z37_004726 [Ammoniphilus resinae]|uniref:Uncharacterized protein n=1 Tax=Ammoniphilus resinae TaxID=861532 RepID=A0ABS4GWT6_9BACL|nr:hypothetical protein [Ammoniphilus resinae]